MKCFLLFLLPFLLWPSAASAEKSKSATAASCEPAYAVLDDSIKIEVGASELSFGLLAVGCKDRLATSWPPNMDKLMKALTGELREPHPVQILFLIRDHSPELRRRITKKVNDVLGKPVVYDVFLYDAKAAE